MIIINTSMPKLCHARPGDAIRLLDEDGNPTEQVFIVCVVNQKGKRHMRTNVPHGLYDEERPLFIVDLATGQATSMPHLSSRVEILRNATVTIEDGQ